MDRHPGDVDPVQGALCRAPHGPFGERAVGFEHDLGLHQNVLQSRGSANSRCFPRSAAVCSPEAVATMSSKISSPTSASEAVPSAIRPASRSMCSEKSSVVRLLLEILITGTIGEPVGVPRPVVKQTSCAP